MILTGKSMAQLSHSLLFTAISRHGDKGGLAP